MRKMMISGTLVLISLGVALAQAPQPQEAEDAAQVAQDVELLRVVRRIALTQEQIQELLPLLQKAQQAQAEFAQERAEATERLQEHIEAVIDSLARGRAPTPARDDIIRDRLSALERKRQQLEQKLQKVWDEVISAVLTPDQAALIETRQQEAKRLARLKLWQGAKTALDFVMNSLKQARDLMPDEYANARLAIAGQTAAGLLDPAAPGFSALQSRVAALFDELYPVPAQQFQRDEARITEYVAQTLQITPTMRVPDEDEIIPYSRFMDVIKNPRTLELLGGVKVTPTPEDHLQPLLNALDALRLAHTLQLDAAQLRELASYSTAIQDIISQQNQAKAQLEEGNVETLKKVREALLAGTALDTDLTTQLEAFETQAKREEESFKQRVRDEALDAFDVLYPKQQDLVTLPPELLAAPRPAGPETPSKASGYSQLKERLVALLTQSRGMDPIEFAATYPDAIPSVLEEIAPPETRAYYRARWHLRRLMRRAALVPDEEFPMAVDQLADEFLRSYGLIPEALEADMRPIPFEEFQRILVLPETARYWERLAQNLPAGWRSGSP